MSVVLAFLYLMQYDKENYTKELNNKYTVVAEATLFHLNSFITDRQIQKQIKDYKMEEITEEQLKREVLLRGEILDAIVNRIGQEVSIISYKNDNYLNIVYGNINILLKDSEFQPYRYSIIRSIFGLVLLIIVFTYILIIRKIHPLKKLKQNIDKFAAGEFDTPPLHSGTDEISEVANAFYLSVNHIKKLNHSRQLFLRNIMHELKTPITKGRILAEMIHEDKQKQRLITVFERLETMINEFASIESLTSGIGLTNVGTYRLIDIFDEAIDLAMVERKSIDFYIEKDLNLHVDFKLFSLALKNMIDNAIKYSTDKKVTVKADDNAILFINEGAPLDRPIEHYLSPFTQGNNSTKNLGLGLYIVDNIIKAHRLELVYRYEDGKSTFGFVGIDKLKK
jgi:two-component system OmpR family sensor kinase